MHSQKLPGIDGELAFLLVPEAGSGEHTQVSPSTDVRGVGPEVQVGRHLTVRHSLRETGQVEPPPQIPKAVLRPGDPG